MSLSAKSQPLAVRKQVEFNSLEAGLREWDLQYQGGRIWDVATLDSVGCGDRRKLQLHEIDAIHEGIDDASLEELIKEKSSGAKYIARRLHKFQDSMQTILSDWAANKELRHWIHNQDPEYLEKMDLDHAGKLFYLGIRFAWQADLFCQLYSQVCDTKRPWGSCYQPSHKKVKALALTANYRRLPLWVKKVLVNSPHWIETSGIKQERTDRPDDGRIGDIWRLINCAKAWKWCGHLPKKIAERIGKMSIKYRVLAALAWKKAWSDKTLANLRAHDWKWWRNGENVVLSRNEVETEFWMELRQLEQQSVATLLPHIRGCFSKKRSKTAVELLLKLPFGFLDEVWGRDNSHEEYVEIINKYSDPKALCQRHFGSSGKGTIKAFQNCSTMSSWKWAQALAFSNPDYLQKYLSLKNCVPFEKDVIAFLQALQPSAALRMVGTTTFKVRGGTHLVESFHVRDTGYLWQHLQPNPPQLGRVRCWLTVHEELGAEYVERLPDFDLQVHPK